MAGLRVWSAILLFPAAMYAQDFRATLSGSVTNTSSARIPAATVNATNSVQRPGPDTTFNNVTFGQLPKSQLNFPRFLQLAAKFYF